MTAVVSLMLGDYEHSFAVAYTYRPAEESTDTPETVEVESVYIAGSTVEIKLLLRHEDARLTKCGMAKHTTMPRIEEKLLKGEVL